MKLFPVTCEYIKGEKQFYYRAQKFYEDVPASEEGMMGDYVDISNVDLEGSREFLKRFVVSVQIQTHINITKSWIRSSTVASVCEYIDWFTVAVISEHTRQNLFWTRNLSSWLYKKNSTVFHVGGGVFLIVAQTWCQPHKHPIQNKLSQQLLISLYCGHFLLPLISSQWRRRRRYFWDFLSRNIQSVMKYNKVYNCFKVISLKGHV